ncbi:MAG: 50S ribosomal protein L9 [Bacteroidales bacterium]|nr:50S ribosomal protein L9 [Candidatus Cryptobacteroides equifaecalis]
MKIILKKEVANLGEAGEVVEVKTGYALNYLVPQGFATVATASALKQHEETIRQRAHKEAKLVADAEAAAAKLSAIVVKIVAKVGESGKLYGAVTAAQVAEQLPDVDKKNVTVPEIKELGEFEAKVKCYKGVFATVKVEVVAE